MPYPLFPYTHEHAPFFAHVEGMVEPEDHEHQKNGIESGRPGQMHCGDDSIDEHGPHAFKDMRGRHHPGNFLQYGRQHLHWIKDARKWVEIKRPCPRPGPPLAVRSAR